MVQAESRCLPHELSSSCVPVTDCGPRPVGVRARGMSSSLCSLITLSQPLYAAPALTCSHSLLFFPDPTSGHLQESPITRTLGIGSPSPCS